MLAYPPNPFVRSLSKHGVLQASACGGPPFDRLGLNGKRVYFASAISFAASAPAQSLPPFQRHTSLPAESNSTVVGRFAFHPSDNAI